MTNSVTLHTVDAEPRIHDLELARRLGYGRPAKIRDLIKSKADELARYGILSALEKAPEATGGRPTTEFFLNEGQAIRIATLADMVETPEVCEMVIKAYIEHRHSRIAAPAQTPDLATILSILQQVAETLALLTKHMAPR
ncbi:hypothetical protein [Rhizobium hidalgonense]|uniref:hypothetical protein n=1 Tax=Rhizobium hidalgonense TaxID=1538159 RepID=UPI002870BCA1|nr:hypothetical protein [Rhizobium hidalgonense]MDR9811900.1 hypothetical protein [Rhizobium hidalgonense]